MAQNETSSRFDRLSREILDGSLPYGVIPGRATSERFAAVFEHEFVPEVTMIFSVSEAAMCGEVAYSLRWARLGDVDRVTEDVRRFLEQARRGEEGLMLPFAFLPKRVAIRRLRRLLDAH